MSLFRVRFLKDAMSQTISTDEIQHSRVAGSDRLMEFRYCRHCKKDVPMFNDKEYRQLSEVHRQCIEEIKKYRRTHETTLAETPLDELYRPLFSTYKELTGIELIFGVDEVMRRHYLSRWEKYRHEAG